MHRKAGGIHGRGMRGLRHSALKWCTYPLRWSSLPASSRQRRRVLVEILASAGPLRLLDALAVALFLVLTRCRWRIWQHWKPGQRRGYARTFTRTESSSFPQSLVNQRLACVFRVSEAQNSEKPVQIAARAFFMALPELRTPPPWRALSRDAPGTRCLDWLSILPPTAARPATSWTPSALPLLLPASVRRRGPASMRTGPSVRRHGMAKSLSMQAPRHDHTTTRPVRPPRCGWRCRPCCWRARPST